MKNILRRIAAVLLLVFLCTGLACAEESGACVLTKEMGRVNHVRKLYEGEKKHMKMKRMLAVLLVLVAAMAIMFLPGVESAAKAERTLINSEYVDFEEKKYVKLSYYSTETGTFECEYSLENEAQPNPDHQNKFTVTTEKAATCAESGVGMVEYKINYKDPDNNPLAVGGTMHIQIPTLAHTWSDDWSIDEAAGTHYHKCENCDARNDEEEHSFDGWKRIDDKNHILTCACGATSGDPAPHTLKYYDPDGEKHSVFCTDFCGYEEVTGHTWEKESDENEHWEECVCGAIRNKAPHDLPVAGVPEDDTCHTKTCGTCQAVIKEDHQWKDACDSENHWKQCKSCGAVKEKEAHSFVYTSGADDTHIITCSKQCGLEISEKHSWAKKADAKDHWLECTCGETKDKAAHTWTLKSDETNHWEECTCGETKDKAAHTPGTAVEENRVEPQIGVAGSYDLVTYCTVCKAETSREKKTIDPLPETVKEYTVTYKNDNGAVLQTGKWKEGQIPLYTGTEPSRKSTAYCRYHFTGWSPAVTAVTGDAEYTAVFRQLYNSYEVEFVISGSQGDEVQYARDKVIAGSRVQEPARPEDIERPVTLLSNRIYTFSHWSEGLDDISKGYDFSQPVTHDITLYAIYKDENEYPYTADDIAHTEKSGCYIATCVYGSYDCPEVWVLRRFRDNVLAKSDLGRAFIRVYYALSPKVVEQFGGQKWFTEPVRSVLDLFVGFLKGKGFEDTPYQDAGGES